MNEQAQNWTAQDDRLRVPAGRRALVIFVVLLLESLLLLALLSLGATKIERPSKEPSILALEPNTTAEKTPEKSTDVDPSSSPTEREQAEDSPAEQERVPGVRARKPEFQPEARPPSFITLSREELAAADIRSAPVTRPSVSASPPKMGPPAPSRSGDTPLVDGTGPNGERLYAAAWYREPYDRELRGYLSTADGPGWGLIACRTVPDFRVEDCVAVGENPRGSNITRAVLAAAWQFRVRPPRINGRPQIGEWVRIRIDYLHRR